MKITFLKGKNAGESRDFEPPGVFIGREEDNDIQLLLDGVSQYHAKMTFNDDKWVLHDLDSSNGTKVNGNKIKEPTPLNSGDMIYISTEAMKIEFDKEKPGKTAELPLLNKDDAIRIRSSKDTKKYNLPIKEEQKESESTKKDIKKIPKKTKEQRAQEREINLLIQEALREKKKRLTIIAIIIAIVANAIIVWWYWFANSA